MVAEYDAGGVLKSRYVHGADGKADDPIAWYKDGVMEVKVTWKLR